jgi:hypothetical protein
MKKIITGKRYNNNISDHIGPGITFTKCVTNSSGIPKPKNASSGTIAI